MLEIDCRSPFFAFRAPQLTFCRLKKIVFTGIEQTSSGNTVESTCLELKNANCFHRRKKGILTPITLIKQLLIITAADAVAPGDGCVPNNSGICKK